MFKKFLWKHIIRRLARVHGYLDPIALIARLSRFAQPSEVLTPSELVRAAAVLHARGLMNAQVIQHNLDWVWPFWVNKQFDPHDSSFIPRSFSLTHINLTHRNWTAAGQPDVEETPLVDPRGLVTPFWDSWSIDAWITNERNENLIPSRMKTAKQSLSLDNNCIVTEISNGSMHLISRVDMTTGTEFPTCRIHVVAEGNIDDSLVISLRPYNPEGVSLVKDIAQLEGKSGWKVDKFHEIYFNASPERYAFSNYESGDVYHRLYKKDIKSDIHCSHEMSSAAAVFPLGAEKKKELIITIPLQLKTLIAKKPVASPQTWAECLKGACQVQIPDEKFKFLFDASTRTLLIHTAQDVYAGPYTYKRFWFRDAVFITYTLLCCGFHKRAERIIDQFEKRQMLSGYFESQEGEWDSNGQVLWLIHKYCQMTNQKPKDEWRKMIFKGARWIIRKRLSKQSDKLHDGLMPAGFSAEHFGPNDYYYWDDFWCLEGLKGAASLFDQYGDKKFSRTLLKEVRRFSACIEDSLNKVEKNTQQAAMPSSPYRRLDSASIGTLVAGYPLQYKSATDYRILETANYLIDHCLVHNGFFHDMSHSGINPYLTLHIAQVLLRAGDKRYFRLMKGIADLASPTGQWPEAVHPITKGGCMGDGQHAWGAAEWLMMVRNCFVREEEKEGKLILCSGIPVEWLRQTDTISFGPTSTIYGEISLKLKAHPEGIIVEWDAKWHNQEPTIEINFPDLKKSPFKNNGKKGSIKIKDPFVFKNDFLK